MQNEKLMRWHEVVNRLPKDRPIVGAEVGVWEGRMSEELLRALPNLTLYMVDRWTAPKRNDSYFWSGAKIARMPQQTYSEARRKACQRIGFASLRARVIQMESGAAAEHCVKEGLLFDFVFIDADHSFDGCTRDINVWLPLVKEGGWIGGHDYSTLPTKKGEVKRAVDTFFGSQAIVTGDDSVWFHQL